MNYRLRISAVAFLALTLFYVLLFTLWSHERGGKLTADETQIHEVARQHFLSKGKTLTNVEFEIPVRDSEGWRVHVNYFPSKPGSHGTLYIDKSGKVIRYLGGK